VSERAAATPDHDYVVVHIDDEPVLVAVGCDLRADHAEIRDGIFEKIGRNVALRVDIHQQGQEGVPQGRTNLRVAEGHNPPGRDRQHAWGEYRLGQYAGRLRPGDSEAL
jgi:hypothetical protein